MMHIQLFSSLSLLFFATNLLFSFSFLFCVVGVSKPMKAWCIFRKLVLSVVARTKYLFRFRFVFVVDDVNL